MNARTPADGSAPSSQDTSDDDDLQAVLSDLDSPLRLSWPVGAFTISAASAVAVMVAVAVRGHLTISEGLSILLATAALVGAFSWQAWKKARRASRRLRASARRLEEFQEQLKKQAAATRRLEGLLVDAVESVNEGFVLFDAEGILVVCNDRYRHAYPAIADQLQPGNRFADILETAARRLGVAGEQGPEDLKLWVDDRLNRHLENSDSAVECPLADGRWYRISEQPTRAGGIVKILTDITSDKEHASEMAHKTDVLETTFDAMAHGIAVFDNQSRLLAWNDHFGSLMGYPESLLANGTPVSDFLAYDDSRHVEIAPLRGGMLPCEQDPLPEHEVTLPDGRHVEIHMSPMPRGGMVVAFADVTARRQAESALQQSQKMDAIGQLAGGMAHEFNNMLTSIGGFARMALRSPGDGERVVMCLHEVTRSADRAASLTSQLLNFSRRSVSDERRPVHLKALLKDLSNFLRPLLGERVDVFLDIHAPDATVAADPNHLHQAIVNLCINARDAMPDGGEIVLSLEQHPLTPALAERHPHLAAGQFAALSVIDQGTGIDPAIVDRIFEPFFTTKEQGKGTGLGLPMVYSTAEHLGGAIEVQSTPGQGSTFTLYLPLLPVAASGDESPAQEVPFDGDGVTVLLAEDEDAVRRLVTLTLEDHGCTVLTAMDGLEAAGIFSQSADMIDILISDVVMPGLDGPALTRMLLQRKPQLKVILMSGYSPDDHWKTMIEGLGRAFLSKPVDPARLVSCVKSLLALPAASGSPAGPGG